MDNTTSKPSSLTSLLATSITGMLKSQNNTPVVKRKDVPTTSTKTTQLLNLLGKDEAVIPTHKQIVKAHTAVEKIQNLSGTAKYLMVSSGKQTSMQLVNHLAQTWSGTSEELVDMFYGCKKYSFKKTNFDDVIANSLKLSDSALTERGYSEEQITKSKPRVVFKERCEKIKNILKKYFWDKNIPDRSLSWGNFVRIPAIEATIKEFKSANLTCKPSNQASMYSNAYWMVGSWKECYGEMLARVILTGLTIKKAAAYANYDPNNGLVSDFPLEENVQLDLSLATLPIKIDDITGEIVEFNKLNVTTQLTATILPDVRKLLQCSEMRQNRSDKDKYNKLLSEIIVLMKAVMTMGSIVKSKATMADQFEINEKTELKKTSNFVKEYYKSLVLVRAFIRSLKIKIFGAGSFDVVARHDLEDIRYDTAATQKVDDIIESIFHMENPTNKQSSGGDTIDLSEEEA